MKKLFTLISEVLQIPPQKITDSLAIDNSETWDSLKHMELIVAIEEEYNINLKTSEIVAMTNVKAIRQILQKKGVDTKNEH